MNDNVGPVAETPSSPAPASRRFVLVALVAAFSLGIFATVGVLVATGTFTDDEVPLTEAATTEYRESTTTSIATTTTSTTTTSTTTTTSPPPPPPAVAPTTECEGVSGCLLDNGIDFGSLRAELAAALTADGFPTGPDDVECTTGPETSGPNRVPTGASFQCIVPPSVNGALTAFIVMVTGVGTYAWEYADV